MSSNEEVRQSLIFEAMAQMLAQLLPELIEMLAIEARYADNAQDREEARQILMPLLGALKTRLKRND